MHNRQPPENTAAERTRPEEEEVDEPMSGSAYGASSAESGGNYDQAGPTTANVEGEPMDDDG